ncbi:GPW/gp25 family protein [Sorangium sp. So ce281]|uniref:GPW/gp25 family protein n=1 Tax=unclassified Sorangium TaxID=2621164 RepID=UPI003F5F7130
MSLLGRLAGERMEPALKSVARNLATVLNAKKGYAEAAEVFGLGDYDEHLATTPLIETLGREMLKLIEDYEPRAEKPVLTFLGADSTLYAAFQLQCEVEGSPAAFWIRMHTILRYVTVEPMAPGPDGGRAPA